MTLPSPATSPLKEKLLKCFSDAADESRGLYVPSARIERHDGAPTPLEFHRRWVARNAPCVFTGAFDHWPALSKWKEDRYLVEAMGDRQITVTATGNGLADAVLDGKFVLPEERMMTMEAFTNALNQKDSGSSDTVLYIQKQNSNLSDEFARLRGDVDAHVPWATEALGVEPDAVNFWMGQQQAVTSLHKDHYENLYCVVRGSKTFTLIPPCDRPFVTYEDYPVATQRYEDGKWRYEDSADGACVSWIPIDPLKPDLERYPNYAHCRPLEVTVEAGEMLYLPAMWFHHVQQSDRTVAVNYWYDMQYDMKYNYYHTLDGLTKLMEEL